MMGSSKSCVTFHRSIVRGAFLRRQAYSTAAVEERSLEQMSQRELREKAVAEALAREEEAAAKAKALRELKNQTRDLLSTLNKIPSTLVNSRLQKLQGELDGISNQEKVKQLDQELEEFMFEKMNLPQYEIQNRPWAVGPKQTISSGKQGKDDDASTQIKSTTSNSYTSQFPNLKPTPDYKPYSTQELYLRQLAHSRQSGSLGSELSNIYKPRDEVRKPRSISETTISTLMAAGCHLGHAKAMWRPSTQPYIYGEYNGIHLIDLNETLSALNRATQVIKGVAAKGGVILYVGTTKNWEQHRALEEAAKRTRGYYVSKRWVPGTITNFTEVTKQIGGSSRIEVDMMDQPTDRKLGEETSGNLIKPDLIVLLNPVENRNCINECIKQRIPTIGLCDTDMEPSLLTYPIPCNDDSMRASSLMTGILSKSAEEGLNERLNLSKEYKAAQSKFGNKLAQKTARIVNSSTRSATA